MNDLESVATSLGLERHGRRWSPCPKCGQARTGTDRRATVLLSQRGWWCVVCKTGGPDDVSLVAWVLNGGKRERVVFDFLERGGYRRPTEHKPEPPPRRIDPLPALRRAKPLGEVGDARLTAWLERRHISPNAPAGWLPDFRAPWWPHPETWPVVIPACTGTGIIESMHGIAISPDAPHKTTWPRGAESRELLFATRETRAWLQGKTPAPEEVLIVEGATDFLTAVIELPECAVLGLTSGSAATLGLVPKTKTQTWYIATDPDTTGQRYARQAADILFPTPLYPFPMG